MRNVIFRRRKRGTLDAVNNANRQVKSKPNLAPTSAIENVLKLASDIKAYGDVPVRPGVKEFVADTCAQRCHLVV